MQDLLNIFRKNFEKLCNQNIFRSLVFSMMMMKVSFLFKIKTYFVLLYFLKKLIQNILKEFSSSDCFKIFLSSSDPATNLYLLT